MKKDTSWSSVGKWYDERVASKGHLYHQEVIFPKLKQWLKWKKGDALLDLGCGQGVFSRQLPEGVDYCGIDLAKPLIKEAQKRSFHTFLMGDATSPLPTKKKDFSHALFLLSLQNMSDGKSAIQNAKNH
ncbi:MAG: class I SAM-dependent methyltransferase, partial [Chlamydiia bacterium]|nr:class I SAM-dependent methyltransferase [Chlamydiia bacterium]